MKYLLTILFLLIFSCDSGGGDVVEVEGCTDANACNFNADATIEDNSCEQLDCNNECGGTSVEDECGICDDNPSNDCVNDCAGIFGGDAFIDDCGQCVEGTTGLTENYLMDECNVCNGSGIPESECDCNGNVEDVCGVCDGDGIGCDVDLTIYHPGNNGTFNIYFWRVTDFELETSIYIPQNTYEKIEGFIPPGTYYIEFYSGVVINWITITFEVGKDYIIKTEYGEGQAPTFMDTWVFETNGEYTCPTQDLSTTGGVGTDYNWACEERLNRIQECPQEEPPYCIP